MSALTRFYVNQKDLIFVVTLMLVGTLVVLFLSDYSGALRTLIVLPMILLLPGYTLSTALFPKQADLDAVQRLALSLGFSVVAVVSVGLALNYSPLSIEAGYTSIGLLIWVYTLSCITWLRRNYIRDEPYFQPTIRGRHLVLGLGLLSALLFIADLTIPGQRYTEFYVLGAEGRLDSYPGTLQANQTFALTIGVNNNEGRGRSYSVRALSEGDQASIPEQLLGDPYVLPSLATGESWQGELRLLAPAQSGEHVLTLHLYREGDKEPYRTLYLNVSVADEPSAALKLARQG